MKKIKRQQAIFLRKKGKSINEIARKLSVSKSTVSVWVRGTSLDPAAQKRLIQKDIFARIKAVATNRSKKEEIIRQIDNKIGGEFSQIKIDKQIAKLYCALLYWCEGEKNSSTINFTNSDVELLKVFIGLFRKGFKVDEKKFRVCLHLHGYHKKNKMIRFWSEQLDIDRKLFFKPYLKMNTGKSLKPGGYNGCVSLRYNDYKMAVEFDLVIKKFCRVLGG